MEFWLILLIILLILIGIIAARIVFEVTHPEIKRYSVRTDKLSSNEKVRIAFLADLHSRSYGRDNIRLIKMISKAKPDFIVLGGDMITASDFLNKDSVTVTALEGMTNIAPVFYAPGNHEHALSESEKEKQRERYSDYMFELECMDVNYLQDKKEILTEDMYIYGLDIDQEYYRKFKRNDKKMPASYIGGKLGRPDTKKFNILVAHSPKYFDTYASTEYDVVLCGHYHGGTVNLPWTGPLIAPDFTLRPEHSGGAYRKDGTIVIVTRGIGSHLINIRLFNRPEVVLLDIKREGKANRE